MKVRFLPRSPPHLRESPIFPGKLQAQTTDGRTRVAGDALCPFVTKIVTRLVGCVQTVSIPVHQHSWNADHEETILAGGSRGRRRTIPRGSRRDSGQCLPRWDPDFPAGIVHRRKDPVRVGRPLDAIGGDRIDGRYPTLSPDGRRLAFMAVDPDSRRFDLWVRDLERETETRLTLDDAFELYPSWTPSGEEIVFTSWDRAATKLLSYAIPADGSGAARPLGEGFLINSVTADGWRSGWTVGRTGRSS